MTATWDHLVRCALLGTERHPFSAPDASSALMEILDQLPAQPSELAALSASAAVWLYDHAGRRHRLPSSRDVDVAPPQLDDLKPVLRPAADRLAAILAGDHADVLPEWLGACATANKRIPHRLLPDVLEAARTKRDLRPLLPPVIGSRGRWLITLNPEWNHTAAAADDPSAFDTGSPATRTAYLERLRETDPAKARELVESVWSQEPPETRQSFLGAFRTNLTVADEPFLESALDDKRKEVRKTAADLLAQLPESRFTQRMLERLNPLLTYTPATSGSMLKLKKGAMAKVDVTLPSEPDKSMTRDGIDAKPAALSPKLGQRAVWLGQMLAMVRPDHWWRAWNTTPEDLINNTDLGEWKSALLDGWASAAARHRDAAWANALLNAWTESKVGFDADRPELVELLAAALPPDQAEAIAGRLLQDHTRQEDQRLIAIVKSLHHDYSSGYSRTLLNHLRRLTQTQGPNAWYMRSAMKEFALRISPALAQEAAESWPEKSAGWDWWSNAVHEMCQTLFFRHTMLKEINS